MRKRKGEKNKDFKVIKDLKDSKALMPRGWQKCPLKDIKDLKDPNDLKPCGDWQIVKLGDIASLNSHTYSPQEKWEYVNYLDTGNITAGTIGDIATISQNDPLPSRARRKVTAGDIVYSTVRPIQRHYGIIKKPLANMLVSTGFAVITPDEKKCDANFLYHFLAQDCIVEKLQTVAEHSTSTYPSIKPSDIESLSLSLPPLSEQIAIAEILSALDDKIENNTRINTNLEEQAKAIFKSWFVDFAPFKNQKSIDSPHGKIPQGWTVESLSNIADYINGLAMQKFRPALNENSLPVLKIKELRQGFCDSNSDRCSSDINKLYLIKNGDIIFSWSGTLHLDFWCGNDCGLNQHLFKVSSSKYAKWFCYLWTNFHLGDFINIANDKATTMGHIKREHLERAKVLIPDQISYDNLSKLLTPIFDLIILTRNHTHTLTHLRDTLLPKLMSGEIKIKKRQEGEKKI